MMKMILVLLLLLIAVPAWADTVAVDAASTQTCTACSSLSWSHTTAAGSNRGIACSAHTSNGSVTSITYNGVAMTSKASKGGSSDPPRVELFYATGQATGVNTVAISFGLSDAAVGACVSFTGVDQTTMMGTASFNTNANDVNSSPPSITVPTNGMGYDVVFFFASSSGCLNAVPGGSQTERFDVCADAGLGDSTVGAGSTISTTGTMSWSNQGGAPFAGQIAVPINAQADAVAAPSQLIIVE